MTAPETAAIREAITEHWGPRCRTLDTEDFPELVAPGEGRCPACRAWEQLDALCDALDAERAEKERLRDALGDIVSWFSGGPSRYGPWIIEAGEYGADDSVEAARAALAQNGGQP